MKAECIYIGGNIDRLEPKEVIERFNVIQSRLESMGFNVRNPVRDKKASNTGMDFMPYEPNEIVHRDLSDIDKCDYMIAFMGIPSIGTSMEIMYSRFILNIPVIVVTTNPEVYKHYWIRSLASKVVPDIDTAISYIKEWYDN